MPYVIRYRCQPEVLPMIEAALAANGYIVEVPLERSIGGAATMVMTQGTMSLLFTYNALDRASVVGPFAWQIVRSVRALTPHQRVPHSSWPA